MQLNEYLRKIIRVSNLCSMYPTERVLIDQIPIVRDYYNIIFRELLGFLLIKKIKFIIIICRTVPISKALCRMVSMKPRELMLKFREF